MAHNLQIIPISAFEDNYIWLIHNGKQAIVVDPGDEKPVLSVLKQRNLTLVSILITHHHHDHIDGVSALLAAYPQAHIYAPKLEHYHFPHTPVSEPDTVTIDALALTLHVIDCAGHTVGHIAYYASELDWLFSGDVIFGAGCGFVPEGAYTQAYRSLQKIAALPAQTKIFCTHEYTLQNVLFARTLEPNNTALTQRLQCTQQYRAVNQPSLPTTVALELATNPYLRCDSTEILASLKINTTDNVSTFSVIRILKNQYNTNR